MGFKKTGLLSHLQRVTPFLMMQLTLFVCETRANLPSLWHHRGCENLHYESALVVDLVELEAGFVLVESLDFEVELEPADEDLSVEVDELVSAAFFAEL